MTFHCTLSCLFATFLLAAPVWTQEGKARIESLGEGPQKKEGKGSEVVKITLAADGGTNVFPLFGKMVQVEGVVQRVGDSTPQRVILLEHAPFTVRLSEKATFARGDVVVVTGRLDEIPTFERMRLDATVSGGKVEHSEIIAWGKPANDLQLGVGFRRGDGPVVRVGDAPTFVVKVRNTGIIPANVTFMSPVKILSVTAWKAGETKPLADPVYLRPIAAFPTRETRTLKPLETVEILAQEIPIRTSGEEDKDRPILKLLPGTYDLQFRFSHGGSAGPTAPDGKRGPALTAGKLRLEVRGAEARETGK